MNVRRYDVFLVDMSMYKLENHFMCCVSNWKNNNKSSSYNFVMMSSKVKKHPNHIDVTFLEKDVQIQCESIFTITKNQLIYHAGTIEDANKRLEINQKLSSQLELDSKYNNNSLYDMQKLFVDNVKTMNNLIEVKKIANAINDSSKNNKIEECIHECYKLISVIKTSDIEDKNYYNWYAYYHLALQEHRSKDYLKAVESTRESLKYIGNIDVYNKRYGFSMWMLGSIYEKLEQKEQAIKIYKILTQYYKRLNQVNHRASCIFNIANIQKNKTRMNNLLKIIENTDINNNRTDLSKENLIQQMKNEISRI